MTFDEWLEIGVHRGWCSEPFCSTHDMAPMTDEEADDLEADDYDWCIFAVRLWGDASPTAVVTPLRQDENQPTKG